MGIKTMGAWDTTDDLDTGGGNYLCKPGTFHFVITEVRDGLSPKNKTMKGFSFSADVVDGTDKTQVGRSFDACLFPPNPKTHETTQRIAKQLNTAFFIATGVIDASQLGQRVEIDPTKAEGKQFIAKTGWQQVKETDDETGEDRWVDSDQFVEIKYANVFHVDDPSAKDFPKSADALAVIDADDRKAESYFSYKSKSKSASESKPDPKPQPEPAGAAPSSIDMDDI